MHAKAILWCHDFIVISLGQETISFINLNVYILEKCDILICPRKKAVRWAELNPIFYRRKQENLASLKSPIPSKLIFLEIFKFCKTGHILLNLLGLR